MASYLSPPRDCNSISNWQRGAMTQLRASHKARGIVSSPALTGPEGFQQPADARGFPFGSAWLPFARYITVEYSYSRVRCITRNK